MPTTLKDIADRIGVARSTVDRAIHGREGIDPSLKAEILRVAEEMKYRPNILARGLKTNRSSLLGVVVPAIAMSFYADVIQGVQDVASEHGYSLILCTIPAEKYLEQHLSVLQDKRVDGVLISTVAPLEDLRLYHDLINNGTPIVSVSYRVNDLAIPTVTADNVNGGYLATMHLIDAGHTRVGYVGFNFDSSQGVDRYEGYIKALHEAGISHDKTHVHLTPKVSIQDIEHNEYLRELMLSPQRPTAIFAGTDFIAIGLTRLLKKIGLSVPEDVSIVGFNDILASSLVTPALTTISHPKRELGAAACEMLMESMAGNRPEDRVLDVELVIRESVGKPSI
jgi:LacI family transcriptional regulator